jgi:hypothetical protein
MLVAPGPVEAHAIESSLDRLESLRDGLMLLAGYLVTLLAVVSVVALWWGGAYAVSEMLASTSFRQNIDD